jgi:RNA recognition motif-containing protein
MRGKKLFVGNIPYLAKEPDLEKVFSKTGEVIELKIMKNKKNGKSLGVGYVVYKNKGQAEAALEKINGLPLNVEGAVRNLYVAEYKVGKDK